MRKRNTVPEIIRSDFSDDPEMRELVRHFVNELPLRTDAISNLWREQDLRELQRMVHQLKGACGGYGFAPVGEAAERLETAIRNDDDLKQVGEQVMELIEICRRVAA